VLVQAVLKNYYNKAKIINIANFGTPNFNKYALITIFCNFIIGGIYAIGAVNIFHNIFLSSQLYKEFVI
jgi:hypothetical protein